MTVAISLVSNIGGGGGGGGLYIVLTIVISKIWGAKAPPL